MPGSSFRATAANSNTEAVPMSARQPPPVAPRSINVSLQTWQSSTTPGGDNGYGSRHARSASMDSLESSGSSSSGSNGPVNHRGTADTIADYIPTRTVGKTSKLPSHNPLQFVKVQSPLYKKAEQQIKLTKEVKITRETLKEGEEEWQSVCMPTSTDWTFNLDNWKSRRRKVSEKVIQRAEEMRQIEAEEQLRQEQLQQQQRKIKKFSEIVEKRSSSRSYNLDLYIGQGDDSGLGGTPEPDDTIDSHSSILRSDTSEGMTSEAESIDSDIHKSDKIPEKEPPKVPQKPLTRFKREKSVDEFECIQTSTTNFLHQLPSKDLSAFDNFSSTEPSDVEGHGGDNETISSEEDIPFLSDDHNPVPLKNSLCDSNEDKCISENNDDVQSIVKQESEGGASSEISNIQMNGDNIHAFNLCIKSGDNRGFGFTLKGGKDQRCPPYIDSITKYSAADITGLKEGDQIVSLNGEKVTDSSHASLIFSVKQAVYTGVLDVVISRSSEKALSSFSEIQTKSSNRKSSFAEKLALFSSGANGPATNTEINSFPVTPCQTDDNKPKSLVLRRRSAFENGKNENHISHRRSSGLTQESQNMKTENVEKRLSVDLAMSQFSVQECISVKKGPPPPVPVKPKIRPKTPQESPISDLELNISNEHLQNSHFVHPNNILDASLLDINQKQFSYPESSSNKNGIEACSEEVKLEGENAEDKQNGVNNILSDKVEFSKKICHSMCNNLMENNYETLNHTIPNVLSNESSNVYQPIAEIDIAKQSVIESKFEENTFPVSGLSDSAKDFQTITDTYEFENQKEEAECKNSPEFSNSSKPVSESFITVSFTSTKPSVYDEDQIYLENSYVSELQGDDSRDISNIDTDINQVNTIFSQNNLKYDVQSCNENNVTTLEVSNVNESKPLYNEIETFDIVENGEYTDENTNSNIDSLDDGIGHIQINPSPLCLPLEKIDEDDVISASTTTSSETPDTETVIETLPSNLSPLPNDESNGEESSKPSNEIEPVASNFEMELSGDKFNPESSTECLETFTQVPNNEEYTPKLSEVHVNSNCIYPEEQDDEYCRELDESLDQITSLDVIDEIEQRLMHQLEQQGDTYEELDAGLSAQLEDDINKQWLYFTEETELLDDLTPRNLEPPSEPPPPPPPLELDGPVEKLMPMTRANSTKRIKKELWRRRSDFLGLDSPEGIDVDNILLPPPGLEEILKQEREQNQWLEKRLSLAENELSAPLYTDDSVTVESQHINQSEYSDYFLEEEVSNCSVESHSEQWKENLDDEFETSCDLQYVPAADVPSPASEETPKIEESPQRKVKQNIHNLGAAPKAKIMDSTKWITEKVIPVNKKLIEPVFHQNTYNQNYWLARDEQKKVQSTENTTDRRFSMPHFASHHPDVTIRTWGDREYEFQKQRPRSAVWNSTADGGDIYDPYTHPHRQDVLRSHSLDSHRENCDTDTLESEVHNCSYCGKGLCEGSAMGIEALRLYFHIECFRCCICRMQLGNGSCGTDVQVKNNRLYCPSCFTVD